MDPARLILCALLILAPPAGYTVGIIIYNRRRRTRRDAERPTVAEIKARLATDDREQVERTEESESPPPPGWHWPDRDPTSGNP
jgi:hypothetical protein